MDYDDAREAERELAQHRARVEELLEVAREIRLRLDIIAALLIGLALRPFFE